MNIVFVKKLIVICAMFLCYVSVVNAQNAAEFANFARYAEANSQLPEATSGQPRVVFIGNSITDGWIMHDPAFFSENGYIDRGISGQVTSQILLRFRRDVLDLKPALVVIAGGTNDIAEAAGPYDPEVTLGNFKTMVELARANGIKVVIGSLLPCARFTWGTCPDNAPDAIEKMNAMLRDYAESVGVPFADYYPHLVVGEERALIPDWTFDNIHPTLPGYKV
ncbi:MAG: lipase, partial [Muribaculum sp.]|nr:lipase [Muribaculum sp.]